MKKLNTFLSLLLVLLLLFQPFSNITYLVKADNVVKDTVVEDVIIEDTVIEDTILENNWLKDTKVTDTYIREQMIYDENDGLYKVIVGDELSINSYAVEYVVGETSKEELLRQLPPEYAWYDIDWASVLTKFAVGTVIIVVVGVIHVHSSIVTGLPLSIFMGLNPADVAKEAIVSGVMAAAINVTVQGKETQGVSGFSKHAIEGFADGFMWGAIGSVSGPLFKRVSLPKRLKLEGAGSAHIKASGDVVNEGGERIGTAFYDGKNIYLSNKNNFKQFRVFDKVGKELSDLTDVQLKPREVIISGQGSKTILNYTDDLGQVYQRGKNLLPNINFRLGGFTYKTDKLGRVKEVSIDKLKLKHDGSRLALTEELSNIGRGFQKSGDQRGHLIADIFGGSNSLANLVAQNGQVNMGEYKSFELSLKKAIESGKNVENLKLKLLYTDGSFRPDTFRFTYQLDGKSFVKEINNVVRR